MTREWEGVDTATLGTIAAHLRQQIAHPNRIDIWDAAARAERRAQRESDRVALASAEAELARREARCICAEMGATGRNQRHTLCTTHEEGA